MTDLLIANNINHNKDLRNINFSNYIDYSSPPHLMSETHIVIVDISNIVTYYSDTNNLISLFNKFPLKDIISTLLSNSINMSQIPNYNELILTMTEEKLGMEMESIDFDLLELFYEGLQESLDNEISKAIPNYRISGDYVFERWIDPVSICLKLSNNNRPKLNFMETSNNRLESYNDNYVYIDDVNLNPYIEINGCWSKILNKYKIENSV